MFGTKLNNNSYIISERNALMDCIDLPKCLLHMLAEYYCEIDMVLEY
jgi:hypothetical protein